MGTSNSDDSVRTDDEGGAGKRKRKGKGKEQQEGSFIEIRLPSTTKEGWDIGITSTSLSNSRSPSNSVAVIDSEQTTPSSFTSSSLPMTTPPPKFSVQLSSSSIGSQSNLLSRYTLKISHSRQKDGGSTDRLKVAVNRCAKGGGVISMNGTTISPTPILVTATTDTNEESEESENNEHDEQLKKWSEYYEIERRSILVRDSPFLLQPRLLLVPFQHSKTPIQSLSVLPRSTTISPRTLSSSPSSQISSLPCRS